MAQTNINIRMDEDLKRDFDIFCSEIGLNMSTAFNIFAKTVVRHQRIPFELALNTPNAETIAAMEEADRISRDPNTKKYSNTKELFDELRSECTD